MRQNVGRRRKKCQLISIDNFIRHDKRVRRTQTGSSCCFCTDIWCAQVGNTPTHAVGIQAVRGLTRSTGRSGVVSVDRNLLMDERRTCEWQLESTRFHLLRFKSARRQDIWGLQRTSIQAATHAQNCKHFAESGNVARKYEERKRKPKIII